MPHRDSKTEKELNYGSSAFCLQGKLTSVDWRHRRKKCGIVWLSAQLSQYGESHTFSSHHKKAGSSGGGGRGSEGSLNKYIV
jgi:hypothetical protein